MTLTSASRGITAIAVAYVVCAFAGVNLWMYIWLKNFYYAWTVAQWITLAILLIVLSRRAYQSRVGWLFTGAAAGYVAGLIVYQLLPVLRHGFKGTAATIAAEGLYSYVFLSMFFPLLTFSWLPGMVAAAAFAAITKRHETDWRIVGYLIGAVVIVGWAFFLSHQGVPLRW